MFGERAFGRGASSTGSNRDHNGSVVRDDRVRNRRRRVDGGGLEMMLADQPPWKRKEETINNGLRAGLFLVARPQIALHFDELRHGLAPDMGLPMTLSCSTTHSGPRHVKNDRPLRSNIEAAHDQRGPLGGGAKRSSTSLEDNHDDLSQLRSLQVMVVYLEYVHAYRSTLDGNMQYSTRYKSHRAASHTFPKAWQH
eukprot:4459571-Pyramimonas_sp.AAC.1